MDLEIDFRSGTPIYLQIIERVKERLASGRLKPGDQLPTVRALAMELRVNFNTIARAYRLMDEAGIISTQQGRGTYILEAPAAAADENIRQDALQDLVERFLAEAERLGISAKELEEAWKKQATRRQENRPPRSSNE